MITVRLWLAALLVASTTGCEPLVKPWFEGADVDGDSMLDEAEVNYLLANLTAYLGTDLTYSETGQLVQLSNTGYLHAKTWSDCCVHFRIEPTPLCCSLLTSVSSLLNSRRRDGPRLGR